ncbi:MAG: ComEA family DNA-binding protein [Thermodesulfobacteriota bacterium]
MRRDTRYGAFLALAALFFCFFMLSRAAAPPGAGPAHAAPSAPPTSTGIEGIIPGFPVDINMAQIEDLKILPGIGDAIAGRILEKRREIGGFTSVEQLTEVRWVGKVKLDRIRSLVTVN